jgi:uncharacterized membrane protein
MACDGGNLIAMASVNTEDEILRKWTPLILRTLLIISAIILLTGLVMMAISNPDYYVERFHAAQAGRSHVQQEWSQLARDASPHFLLMLGLLVLTLVPLARVAFTLILFLKEGDHVFALATSYVLTALIVGVLLGRIG